MKTYSFQRALDFYKPWVAARPEVLKLLNPRPMDLELGDHNLFNPMHLDSGPFIDLVHTLHNMVCGPFGMPMARWVGYDCGLMPGVYFGFGVAADELNRAMRAGLEVPVDYHGLAPYSIGIAIPFPDRQSWEIIGLGSINQVAPGAGPAGLTRLTLAFGTSLLNNAEVWSVARWRSELVGIFAGLAPLELSTAWTPAHDYPETVTFKIQPTDEGRERLLRSAKSDPDEVTTWIDADDTEAMQKLQADLEAGLKVYILGPHEDHGTEVRFPLKLEGEAKRFEGVESFEEEGVVTP